MERLHCIRLYVNAKKDIKLFLDAGPNINATNRHGEMPLHCAVRKGTPNDHRYRSSYRAKKKHWRNFSQDATLILLAAGVNVNAQNVRGRAPLHIAVQRNWSGGMNGLLDNNADIHVRDQNGQTSLHRGST